MKRKALHRKQLSRKMLPRRKADKQENHREAAEPLLENAYPEVNELITRYYAALQSDDLDTVKSLLDYSEDKELLRMQENSSHIESYNNIVCYTKSGLEPDSYVV
ncbi:MAG: hypothetical protein ACLVAW_16170 [Eisenbergiella massiliensis]